MQSRVLREFIQYLNSLTDCSEIILPLRGLQSVVGMSRQQVKTGKTTLVRPLLRHHQKRASETDKDHVPQSI